MSCKITKPITELLAECVDDAAIAKALGVCTETIRRRGDQGKLPFMRNGQKRLYHVPTVMRSMFGDVVA